MDALLTDGKPSHQRVIVDLDAFGKPHVVPDQFEYVGSLDTSVVDLDRRNYQTLSVDVVPIREVAPGEGTAGVQLMAPREEYKDKFVLVEDRANEPPVREVIAVALERVVRDDDVTGVKVIAELLEDRLDGKVL